MYWRSPPRPLESSSGSWEFHSRWIPLSIGSGLRIGSGFLRGSLAKTSECLGLPSPILIVSDKGGSLPGLSRNGSLLFY